MAPRCYQDCAPAGHQDRYEVSLSESGRAFLCASKLVLLKADTLQRGQSLQELEELIESAEAIAEDLSALRSRQARDFDRRLHRRRAIPPPVEPTIGDLAARLRNIILAISKTKPPDRERRKGARSKSQVAQTIAQLAHQENLTETASQLDLFLQESWPEIACGQDWLDLDRLIEAWSQSPAQPEASRDGDRVGVFWALLLLSAQSKVELAQEEFYQDLKIRALSPSARQSDSA